MTLLEKMDTHSYCSRHEVNESTSRPFFVSQAMRDSEPRLLAQRGTAERNLPLRLARRIGIIIKMHW
jgi:hypothetical protein